MATANNVTIISEGIRKAINAFNTQSTEIQLAYLKIYERVNEMGETWLGTASTTFATRFDELHEQLKQVTPQIEEGIERLELVEKEALALEEENKASIDQRADNASTQYTRLSM